MISQTSKNSVQIYASSANAAFAERIALGLHHSGYEIQNGEFDPDTVKAVIVVWTGYSIISKSLRKAALEPLAHSALASVSIGLVEAPEPFTHLTPMNLAGWQGDIADPRWRVVIEGIEAIGRRRARIAAASTAKAIPAEPVSSNACGEKPVENPKAAAKESNPREVRRPVEQPADTASPLGHIDGGEGGEGGDNNQREALPSDSVPSNEEPLGEKLSEKELPDEELPDGVQLENAHVDLPAAPHPERDLAPESAAAPEASKEASKEEPHGETVAAPLLPPSPLQIEDSDGAAGCEHRVAPEDEALQDAIPDPHEIAPPGALSKPSAVQMAVPALGGFLVVLVSGGLLLANLAGPEASSPSSTARAPASPEFAASAAPEIAEPETPSLAAAVIPKPEEAAESANDQTASVAGDAPPTLAAAEADEASMGLTIEEIIIAKTDAVDIGEGDIDLDGLNASLPPEAEAGADLNGEQLAALISAVATPAPSQTVAGSQTTGDSFRVGDFFKECVECPDMAVAPAGTFVFGAPKGELARTDAERPARSVTVDRRFAIGASEVTFEQWDACVEDGGCRAYKPPQAWGRGRQPVINVSWDDAQSYVAWLSAKTGGAYRLPTEVEWEYAARAGASTPFSFGRGLSTDRANYHGGFSYRGPKGDFRGRTTPVASFEANGFGLFDMHGNVWEWTADCWSETHAETVESADCERRVVKGGAWNSGGWRLRAAHRLPTRANAREIDKGFRVARDME